jgi:hypothetical protein
MANHQIELNQKNSFIYKMKETIKTTLTDKSENTELKKFYEDQISERDYTISELTTKLKKINEKASLYLNEEKNLVGFYFCLFNMKDQKRKKMVDPMSATF